LKGYDFRAMPQDKANIALIQMSCSTSLADNFDKCFARIEEAARAGAQIVSTQELFRSQYFCQSIAHANFSLAEPIPGTTVKGFSRLAAGHGVVIIACVFERRAPGIYHSTAVVIDADGTMLGRYRKMHILEQPSYHEGFYFTPGDLGFKSFDTKCGKVGVLLGSDQWYPEAARITALSGAQLLLCPAAIGRTNLKSSEYVGQEKESWETMLRAHAIANGVYVAAVNRVGHEPAAGSGDRMVGGISFWGQSFVAKPGGEVVKRASETREEILLVECDFNKSDIHRTHWPFMRDRRIDTYGDITKYRS
jgi:N-carbamoylputrescine amidase